MRLLRLLPLLLLSSPVLAQNVTLRGKVENVPGTGQFIVDCTDTLLVSPGFNLNSVVGQHVLVHGTVISPSGPPAVNVVSIAAIAEIFEIPGNPQIGGEIRFGATYTAGSRVVFNLALAPGFRRVGRAGTYFLDTATSIKAAGGIIPASGHLEIAANVPNDPALIGLTVYAQAAIRLGAALVLSNPDCKTIQ